MEGNKRGLLGETSKIVLVVIAIVILGYVIISAYFLHLDKMSLSSASSSLMHLVTELKSEEIENVFIITPEDWYLMSWPYGNKLPQYCYDKGWENCICICKDTSISSEDAVKKCDEMGTCLNYNNNVVIEGYPNRQSPIVITDELELKIERQSSGEIIIRKR